MFIDDIKLQKIVGKKSKETYEDKGSADDSAFLMQHIFSNSDMGEILNEEANEMEAGKYNKDPIFSLSEKMRIKGKDPDKAEYIEEFKNSIYSKREDQPKKLMDIDLDTGKVQVGYSDKEKKAVIAIEKKTALDQTANREVERQVIENKATCIRDGGTSYISNDESFENGALALKFNIKNDVNGVINKFNGFETDKKKGTIIQKVLPFLNTEKDKETLDNLKKHRSAMNSKNVEELSTYKDNIEKNISEANTVIVKKTSKKLEFKNSLSRSLNQIKEISQSNIQDDYYLYMKKRWLEMTQEADVENKTETFEEHDSEEEKL